MPKNFAYYSCNNLSISLH